MREYKLIDFTGHKIDVNRKYEHFYKDKAFSRHGGLCSFNLFYNFTNNKSGLRIKDYGGMADQCAASRLQDLWITEKIKPLSIKNFAGVFWTIENYKSYYLFNRALIENKSRLESIRFKVDKSEIIHFIGTIYKNNYNLEIINVNWRSIDRDKALIISDNIYRELGEYCISDDSNKNLKNIVDIILKNPENEKNIKYLYENNYIKVNFEIEHSDERYNNLDMSPDIKSGCDTKIKLTFLDSKSI